MLFTLSVSAQQPRLQPKDRLTTNRFKQIPSRLGLNHSQTKAFKEAVKKYRDQRHQQNQYLIRQLKTILTSEQFEKLKKLVEEDKNK